MLLTQQILNPEHKIRQLLVFVIEIRLEFMNLNLEFGGKSHVRGNGKHQARA
jgi:hypothetical protein